MHTRAHARAHWNTDTHAHTLFERRAADTDAVQRSAMDGRTDVSIEDARYSHCLLYTSPSPRDSTSS
eukprot:4266008-Prorocentrum_lima.AAC.1